MSAIEESALDACFYEIAGNIKRIRKEHSLTQKQMSEKLKIDAQYYARLERGDDPQRRFTLEKIMMVCAMFNVTPNDIVSKLPTNDEKEYNALTVQKEIRKGMKRLSPEKLKGLQEYMNKLAVAE